MNPPPIEDIPSYCRDHIEEVSRVGARLAAIEATQGEIVLTGSTLALVWAIAIATCGAAGASLVTAYQANEALLEVRDLRRDVKDHVALPYHQGTKIQLDNLQRQMDNRRVEGLQRQIDQEAR